MLEGVRLKIWNIDNNVNRLVCDHLCPYDFNPCFIRTQVLIYPDLIVLKHGLLTQWHLKHEIDCDVDLCTHLNHVQSELILCVSKG